MKASPWLIPSSTRRRTSHSRKLQGVIDDPGRLLLPVFNIRGRLLILSVSNSDLSVLFRTGFPDLNVGMFSLLRFSSFCFSAPLVDVVVRTQVRNLTNIGA